jgi:hypothetical protein
LPQKRLSMRKIKEVLRLRFGLGLQQEQIARSCSIGQATVHRYLERARAIGLGWPLPDDCDDQRLNELLFPTRPVWPPLPQRPGVDFSQIHMQLQTHRHLTLQLVWEEYREAHPDTATAIAGSASYINGGIGIRTWYCDRSTVLERRRL